MDFFFPVFNNEILQSLFHTSFGFSLVVTCGCSSRPGISSTPGLSSARINNTFFDGKYLFHEVLNSVILSVEEPFISGLSVYHENIRLSTSFNIVSE